MKKSHDFHGICFMLAAAIGFEPMNVGVRVQCLTTWLSCYG